jgi:hypothetical protein
MREEYDREKLFDEVWAEPVMVVAPRYGLSDVGLKKLCTRLQVPTPARGHWAKVKSGRGIPPKPQLKTYKGNSRYLLKPLIAHRTRPEEAELVDERLATVIAYEQEPAHLIKVPTRGTRWHPLVAATRDAFQATYKDNRGLPLPGGKGLNITVSPEQRPRALRIINALVRGLEARRYSLMPGEHHLEVQMFGVCLSLSIFEATKRSDYVPSDAERAAKARGDWVYWPRYCYTPSGRLEIRSCGGYGGSVKDGTHQVVEEQLNKLIIWMAKRALSIVHFREECARAEERKQAQRREALAQKAIQDAEKEKLEALKVAALRWQQAQVIRSYLLAMENPVDGGTGLNDRQRKYLAWARAKADWLDPLVATPDPLLDQEIRIPY